MFHIYILQSEKNKRLYVGFTSNLSQRLEAHNAGKSPFTRKHLPWRLIYVESYANKKDALLRERRLKNHGKGMVELKKRIHFSLQSEEKGEG